MDEDFNRVWVQAIDQYLKTLSKDELTRIQSINGQQSLLDNCRHLKVHYGSGRVAHYLDRISPFFAKLHSFSEVIRTFINANPEVASLVWGSVFFVLELASRHAKSLDRIVTAFELCDRHTPRFLHYITKFGSRDPTQRLLQALIQYYAELIGICQDAIHFLRRPALFNILVGPFRPLEEKLFIRVERIQALTLWVDQEASVTGAAVREARYDAQHQEVLRQFDIRGKAMDQRLNALSINLYLAPLPVHNLPLIRNPAFFGRSDQLSNLAAQLQPSAKPDELIVCTLYGLGGAGKTQLALEYAYRHSAAYPAIFWISAETTLKLSESFSVMAHSLGIADEAEHNPDQLREIFLRWLVRSSKRDIPDQFVSWLLIFDNVETWQTLEPYWPKAACGSIIVTSRNPEVARTLSRNSARLQISPFQEDEGREFLLSLIKQPDSYQATAEDIAAATAISKALGHLPLPLDLVGSYVASTGMTLGRFSNVTPGFERDFVFDEDIHRWDANSYQSSVNTTWTSKLASRNDATRLGKSSRLLMDLLAFLDPDGAPVNLLLPKKRELLLYGGPDLPDPELEEHLVPPFPDLSSLDRTIAELIRGSFIHRTLGTDRLVCHRIVQIAVVNAMDSKRKAEIFNAIVYLLNAEFPTQPDGESLLPQRKQCEEYNTQVSAMLVTYEWLQDELGFPLTLADIVTRCSWFLFERGQYSESLIMTDKALRMCQRAKDSGTHPGFSPRRIDELLGDLYSIRGTLEYAANIPGHGLEWKQKSRAVRSQIARADNPEDERWVTVSDMNIVVSLMAEDRSEEALNLSERLLRQYEPIHRDTQLANMCICLILLGRYDDAQSYCDQAMELTSEKRGPESSAMAVLSYYQGVIHHRRRDLDRAFVALTECLRLRYLLLPTHPHTGYAAYKLGVVTREKGDLESSITFFREAVRIANNSVFPDVGQRCRAALALVELLSLTANVDEAAQLQAEVSELRKELPNSADLSLGDNPDDYDQFISFSHR